MTNDLPPRSYADEAAKHAHEYPPHIAELQRATAELKDALCRTRVFRWMLAVLDQLVRLLAWWDRRRQSTKGAP